MLSSQDDGVEFKELPALVELELSDDERERLGSLIWYVTTVKLDLEVRGEVERVDGASPQRLLTKRKSRKTT